MTTPPSSLSILVVEDDLDFYEITRRRLLKAQPGLSVDHASTLAQAVDLIAMREYDEIILDLSLPDSPDGICTYAAVYRAAYPIPITILTGAQLDAAKFAAFADAAAILQKDLAPAEALLRPLILRRSVMEGEEAPLRVLLVEDDGEDAGLVELALSVEIRASRLRLERARSLQEALLALQPPCPEAVLLDLLLPDSAGLETLSATIQHCPESAVVVLTGLADAALEERAHHLGAGAVLQKAGATGEQIVSAIRRARAARVKDLVRMDLAEYAAQMQSALKQIDSGIGRLESHVQERRR